jgi:hypothetical protein
MDYTSLGHEHHHALITLIMACTTSTWSFSIVHRTFESPKGELWYQPIGLSIEPCASNQVRTDACYITVISFR